MKCLASSQSRKPSMIAGRMKSRHASESYVPAAIFRRATPTFACLKFMPSTRGPGLGPSTAADELRQALPR